MEIMGKCPFWGEPCIKEECSSFHYTSHCVWDNPDDKRYRAFKKERQYFVGDKKEWYAIGIPYCRVLEKELPMKIENS